MNLGMQQWSALTVGPRVTFSASVCGARNHGPRAFLKAIDKKRLMPESWCLASTAQQKQMNYAYKGAQEQAAVRYMQSLAHMYSPAVQQQRTAVRPSATHALAHTCTAQWLRKYAGKE